MEGSKIAVIIMTIITVLLVAGWTIAVLYMKHKSVWLYKPYVVPELASTYQVGVLTAAQQANYTANVKAAIAAAAASS